MKEYKVIQIERPLSHKKIASSMDKEINKYAKEGWEIFNILPYNYYGYQEITDFIIVTFVKDKDN